MAASSNKLLTASTWADLLASSLTIVRPVSLIRVWINASPTLYGVYVHRYSAATHIQRERLFGAATGYLIFNRDYGNMFYVAATSGEYINFRLGTPYTPNGRRAGTDQVAGNKLNYLIVEEIPFE